MDGSFFLLQLKRIKCCPIPYRLPSGSSARTLRRGRRPSFMTYLNLMSFIKITEMDTRVKNTLSKYKDMKCVNDQKYDTSTLLHFYPTIDLAFDITRS